MSDKHEHVSCTFSHGSLMQPARNLRGSLNYELGALAVRLKLGRGSVETLEIEKAAKCDPLEINKIQELVAWTCPP